MTQKILISAPTAASKNYCFDTWIDNVMKFTYPDFEIVLWDNTLDNGANAHLLNEKYSQKYSDDRFRAIHSHIKNIDSVIERMCVSHNDCRQLAIDEGYSHWLHLETDVLPPYDIIERLLSHEKQVVGGIYYRDEGKYRRLCIQVHEKRGPRNLFARNLDPNEDVFFIDGTLKPVASIGLGCVLIERSVFTKIPFRFIAGQASHPDSYFSEDCFRNKIPIYADTSILCEHHNVAWGIHGVDFN